MHQTFHQTREFDDIWWSVWCICSRLNALQCLHLECVNETVTFCRFANVYKVVHLFFYYKHQVNSAQPQIRLNLNNRPYCYKTIDLLLFSQHPSLNIYSLYAYKKKVYAICCIIYRIYLCFKIRIKYSYILKGVVIAPRLFNFYKVVIPSSK